MAGRHADPGRALLPCARPPRGACQPPRAGTHRAQALGTRPPGVVCPPPRAGPEPRPAGVVPRGAPRLTPRQRGRHRLRAARARPREAVRRRGPHAAPWLAAPQEGAPLRRRGVGPRPRRGADHVGTGGAGPGLHRLRVCPLARGAGTRADLTRVHADHGPSCRGPGPGHRALQAAGGFQHQESWLAGLPPVHARRPPAGLVGDGPARPSGAHRTLPLGLGHIPTAQAGHVTPTHASLPDLAQTGSRAPDNGPGSLDQGSIGLSRPGHCVMGMLPHHPLKIQGWRASAAGGC